MLTDERRTATDTALVTAAWLRRGAVRTDIPAASNVTLTVPSGAGSYQFCSDMACGTVSNNCVTVNAGTSNYWRWNLDGGCPGIDSYSLLFRVSPGNAPGYQCASYSLTAYFQSGLCL